MCTVNIAAQISFFAVTAPGGNGVIFSFQGYFFVLFCVCALPHPDLNFFFLFFFFFFFVFLAQSLKAKEVSTHPFSTDTTS